MGELPRRETKLKQVIVFFGVLLLCSLILALDPVWAMTVETAPIEALRQYLQEDPKHRPPLSEKHFARQPLTKAEAESAAELLWNYHREQIIAERKKMIDDRVLTIRLGLGTLKLRMAFDYTIYGKPVDGMRSLYISLHGGGATSPEVNDQQWENQKKLYQPDEGIYLAPRAPTNDYDLWHKPSIDLLLDYLIESLIVLENVNPNRVYLMGYSAGGGGSWKLAPRMADRFAAVATMAGHPDTAEPYGLRNIGFTIHMGGKDTAYNRNRLAEEWKHWLKEFQDADPDGYKHWVQIYPELGHWMNREDKSALPWMAQFTRDPFPARVVWKQDNVPHRRFYWLKVSGPDAQRVGAMVIASYVGQEIRIEHCDARSLQIRLHDRMIDLDQPVRIVSDEEVLFEGIVPRTIEAIATSLEERKDPESLCYAEVSLKF